MDLPRQLLETASLGEVLYDREGERALQVVALHEWTNPAGVLVQTIVVEDVTSNVEY